MKQPSAIFAPRFWLAQGESYSLDNDGCLYIPEEKYLHIYYNQSEPKQLCQLDETVLVLLGEPGIGKSVCLEQEQQRLEQINQACLYRKLNQYSSGNELIDDIFQSEHVQEWKNGSEELTLLLDSLDECMLSVPTSARILLAQLQKLPLQRLKLRITCRTSDWKASITQELQQLWQLNGKIDIAFELLPLRKQDVFDIAKGRGVDANIFWQTVTQLEIQTLAIHPITLNMLLTQYAKHGSLPSKKAVVYQLGCEHLAAENNAFRQEIKKTGSLDIAQRLGVAGRIAAQMVFCHRNAVVLAEHDANPNVLTERDITIGVETINSRELECDRAVFNEVIGSGLFSGRTENTLGFVHQSYQEYLAAKYLLFKQLSTERILALVQHPEDLRVPSQYAATAIWLASLNKDFFTALVKVEPLLLLQSDLFDISDEQKCELLVSLLQLYATKQEYERGWQHYHYYCKLSCAGLADVLRPYMVDKSHYQVVRDVAISVALQCKVNVLADELLQVALDETEIMHLRAYAIAALGKLECEVHKNQLRTIALATNEADVERELNAATIRALWPNHITSKEIFDLVQEQNSTRCLNSVKYLRDEFYGKFSVDDYLIAMQWIKDYGWQHDDVYAGQIKDDIMRMAWSRLDEPRILEKYAETVLCCVSRYENPVNRFGSKDDVLAYDAFNRRRLFLKLLEYSNSKEDNAGLLWGQYGRFIHLEDLSWLLECYLDEQYVGLRQQLAFCIDWFMAATDMAGYSGFINAVFLLACNEAWCDESPLADYVEKRFGPIDLDSEKARQLKKMHQRRIAFRSNSDRHINPPIADRIQSALDLNDWNWLWQLLSCHENIDVIDTTKPVVEMYGWQHASTTDKTRILCCTKTWLTQNVLTDEHLYRPAGEINYGHTASYRAIELLWQQEESFFNDRSDTDWQHWVEVCVSYTWVTEESAQALLTWLISLREEDVFVSFQKVLRHQLLHGVWFSRTCRTIETLFVASKVEQLLLPNLAYNDLSDENLQCVLGILLTVNSQAALEQARQLVKAKNLSAAQSVWSYQLDKAWDTLWAVIDQDAEWGKSLMLTASHYSHRTADALRDLNVSQIASLYIWLEQQFPSSEDTYYPSGEAHSVTSRDELGRFRDGLLARLANMATPDSICALENIQQQFPAIDHYAYHIVQARKKLRENTVPKLAVDEFYQYTQTPDKYLIRSAAELQQRVLASLQRLQYKLKQQTPLAPFLWDEVSTRQKGSEKPKSEDRMSDFIQHHLKIDLPIAVINREVQVRNVNPSGVGERLDLEVVAVGPDKEQFIVVIESKGCWNADLHSSMETQLQQRYLQLKPEAYGIYLVGCFCCNRWENSKKHNIDNLQATLINQARTLNPTRIVVCVLDVTY